MEEKIRTAKRLFIKIDEQLEKAINGHAGLKQAALIKLREVNEELADAFVDNLKKLERYEREESR